ncbi:hypothetical protein HYC85_030464 [Camellia sinensis]|uniref:Uncharacterized protein n=1 Tax=Camellia sinensis TaxID=4442 RepID=A0A7J7G0S4_CAMSI|nr:hypothetical protein HYC85_030464 [Camellia sinensis]
MSVITGVVSARELGYDRGRKTGNRLGKRTAMHRLPLFSFLHSSGGCQKLRTASLDAGEHHRLHRISTGSGIRPPAQNEAIGRQKIAGRQLTLPVGRVFLQNLQMTATEGKAKHGSTIQGMYAPLMSLIMRPKHALFKDNKERGWPSPSWDFKASSSPLKSLKISVVKRPQHQNPGVHTKGHKMRPFKA